jgi:hypothetical protein
VSDTKIDWPTDRRSYYNVVTVSYNITGFYVSNAYIYIYIYIHIHMNLYVYIQGVPEGMYQTSGGCSLW